MYETKFEHLYPSRWGQCMIAREKEVANRLRMNFSSGRYLGAHSTYSSSIPSLMNSFSYAPALHPSVLILLCGGSISFVQHIVWPSSPFERTHNSFVSKSKWISKVDCSSLVVCLTFLSEVYRPDRCYEARVIFSLGGGDIDLWLGSFRVVVLFGLLWWSFLFKP